MGRCDVYWDDLGVVGEADGRDKYTPDEHYQEKVRQEQMKAVGLLFTRWSPEVSFSCRSSDTSGLPERG
jgi:hypothetical protein